MCGPTTNVSQRDANRLIPTLRRDPTRTTPIQRRFLRQIIKRYNAIGRAARRLIVTEDAFGLTERQDLQSAVPADLQVVGNTRYAFETDSQKIASFRQWLQDQIDLGILTTDGTETPGQPWTATYIRSAYKQAAVQAFIASRPLLQAGSALFDGSQAEFLAQAFDSPIAVDRIELLATRSFENLRGITQSMSTDLNRIFADGIAHGRSPRVIAREIDKTIDGINRARATRIARTEIVHAYAEGSLDSYERLGVEEVGILAEWSTAGDDRVCPRCQPLEGVVMTVKEARGLIPLHPNCRCAWIPYLDDLQRPGKGRTNPRPAERDRAVREANSEGADIP